MSSKRDYIAVAKVIATEIETVTHPALAGVSVPGQGEDVATHIALGLANHFAEHNPAFDREKFITACGVTE